MIDQIRFLTRDGRIIDQPAGAPVIRYVIPHTLSSDSSGQTRVTWDGPAWRLGWALLDTGADVNYMDPEIIDHLGLDPVGAATVQGATSTLKSARYAHHLYFPGSKFLVTGQFVAAPLRQNGRAYSVVIGMAIIRLGTLTMNPRRRIYTFEPDRSLYRPDRRGPA